jgi:hypothetical protein
MRFLVTVVLMLFMFTANQVAASYEHCVDPACADYMGAAEKKSESKKDSSAAHCSAACHQMVAMPQHEAIAALRVSSISLIWAELRFPESALGEGLIEPPSLA